ncbi:MAG: KOW domain-containing RNA-binding protein [Roseburia sp.]|nr:KOW domain-containing RNA-binding protein [Roseburia sp.]
METGDIVISLAGHDRGKPFVIVAQVSEKFALIADGQTRSLENPKLKRTKHLRAVEKSGLENPSNASLKKRLKKFISERRVYAEK